VRQQELFGPVISFYVVKTEDEAKVPLMPKMTEHDDDFAPPARASIPMPAVRRRCCSPKAYCTHP
jgi:hypothetical protein